ncbi:MAG: histidyl-tRNA synthetase [Glaciecola sp.]|jgi:histidyl-tRNA synthetase
MADQISTKPASGTRDFLASEMAIRNDAFATIRRVYESHGFEPLETPAFERIEVLTGKYGEEGDQLIFKILKRGDKAATGEADMALRYDLTVPLARVVARYGSQLPTPWKRYQISPVWRADRPGHGRFREFYQCDADVVGSTSHLAEVTAVSAATDALVALGLEGFKVRINSRKALSGLIESYGVPESLGVETLTALDKLDKIGVDGVAKELVGRGLPGDVVAALSADLGSDDLAGLARERLATTEAGREGLAEVDQIVDALGDNLAGGSLVFDPVLARGLGYYTGPVFEVVHEGLDATIAGGGRYDGLVGMFSGKDVPATGISLGIERILVILAEQQTAALAAPDVLVTIMDDEGASDSLAVAATLRNAGISADVFAGTDKLGKQFKYADRRGVRHAVIRGSDERAAATVSVKDLVSGEQSTIPLTDLVDHLKRAL